MSRVKTMEREGVKDSQESIDDGWISAIGTQVVNQNPQGIAGRCGPELVESARQLNNVNEVAVGRHGD